MQTIKTDLLVIGAGSGGLSVAAGAAQMGADVTLLEAGEMGGDCLNYGCVPSKALLAAAKAAHAQAEAARYGIADVAPQVDYDAVMAHVHGVIDQIAPVDSQERFEGLGVRVIRETGRFKDMDTVIAGDHEITARRIVVATGSSPFVPPIPGLETVPYLTNESLWELRDRPEHLLIIGGGPIGLEMAQAHRRLGCKVTVIEAAKALSKDDPEAAALVLERLRAEGVDIIEGQGAKAVRGSAGAIEVETDGHIYRGTHILVAVGRRANIAALDLPRAGVETTKTGIKVDDRLRTTNSKVFAIGDVTGGLQFTHVAGYQAGIVIQQALFAKPTRQSMSHIPWATYTDPELAQVGLTEAQARDTHGDTLEVVRFDYHHNDRAIAERRDTGWIKAMVVKGRPVGVTIVGAQAGDIAATWSLILANRMKMSQVSAMVAPYPVVAEVTKRVAGAYFSPRLFDNEWVKRVVRTVQRWVP
ncbi:dihydrolipoyl dehydrogenase family protein [Mesobacterium pallidum]|uniref:dihydrolipoyl dehydrogenase family protein n=1 Tax=Mesobacterium pallidum TaxID=2872037 RepID=UPI001EE328D7